MSSNDFDISVCMPVYYKEKPEIIKQGIESILKQTYMPKEIVVILDDPSSEQVENAIQEYKTKYQDLFKVVYIKRGVGIGAISRFGVNNCSCPYIARMDVDDIAIPTRLEKEINCFKQDGSLSVVGSNIAEFVDDVSNIIGYRNVPLNDADCKRYLKKRDPFNHMTVLMKKADVIKAGNYNEEIKASEDTCLWTDMYACGCKFMNMEEILVYARSGMDMYTSRRGKDTYSYVKRVAKHKYEVNLISYPMYLYLAIVNYIVLVMIPGKLRGFIYKYFLRSKVQGN